MGFQAVHDRDRDYSLIEAMTTMGAGDRLDPELCALRFSAPTPGAIDDRSLQVAQLQPASQHRQLDIPSDLMAFIRWQRGLII